MDKNKVNVRIYVAGTLGFEFNCAIFRIHENSDGHTTMYCLFDWEKEDGKGDYDREFGAPEAVKRFLFAVEMNNKVSSFDLDKPFIKAKQFSNNGVYIKEIEGFDIVVK